MEVPGTQMDCPAPDLSLCIVSWNRRDLLDQCLHSIYATEQRVSSEVIVVDNGSSDDSSDMVEQCYPQVRLIRNTDNHGFGRANNQALRISRGRYCLLLNSDTMLLDGTLDAMVAFMDAHPSAAVATGKVYESERLDRVRISFGDTFPTLRILFLNDLVTLTGLRRLFPRNARIQSWVWTGHDPDREQAVAQVTGAFLCVNRRAFEEVGLFDERFFMYMEETDWCYRFRQAGWRVYYTPSAAIVHIGEGSSQLRTDRDRLYHQSICTFFEKHYGRRTLFLYQMQERLLFSHLRRLHRWVARLFPRAQQTMNAPSLPTHPRPSP